MIKVFIPYDKKFWKFKDECKKLYESVQDQICDTNSFEFIIENTFFYLFVFPETNWLILASRSVELRRNDSLPPQATEMLPVSSDTIIAIASVDCEMPRAER